MTRLPRAGSRHADVRRWLAAALLLVASVVCVDRGVAAPRPGDIPDDWFFDGANRPQPLRAIEGQPAPALDLSEWIGDPGESDRNGSTWIRDQRGKVVVVDFWATWCGPCMASIPKNIELVNQRKDQGLVFLGVHDSKSGWEKAQGVVNDKAINYPVVKDTGESTKRFALQFWPTYVVIDRAGVVRAAGLLPDKVHDVVDMLLAEPPPPDVASKGAGGGQPDAWYVGGAKRPSFLRAVEGKTLTKAALTKDAVWHLPPAVNPPTEATFADALLVVHFLSPTSDLAMRQLAELEALATTYEPQGVRFVGICDARADWPAATRSFTERSVRIPILRDTPGTAEIPAGGRASELGLLVGPATLVVDRTGAVRVAGIKADRLKDALTQLLAEPTPVKGASVSVPPHAAPDEALDGAPDSSILASRSTARP